MPPHVNASLTRVTASGAVAEDDWDVPAPAGADAEKWAGTVRGYYREKVDRVQSGGEVNVLVRRTLWIDTADLPAELDTDDVVTVTPDGRASFNSPARTIARSELKGIPRTLQTTRIDLDDG